MTIAYFGYGSLVNLDTLQTPYIDARPGRLRGWERVWLGRPIQNKDFGSLEELAFLSVRPRADSVIDGMVVYDQTESLAALDAREALYDRLTICSSNIEPLDNRPLAHYEKLFMYVGQRDSGEAFQRPTILRSYLDAVFKGFLTHFGRESLDAFVQTTANFHLNVLEDRTKPIYPRAVNLSEEEQTLFDAVIPKEGLGRQSFPNKSIFHDSI